MENNDLKIGDKLVLSYRGCHRVQTIVEITKSGNYKLDNGNIVKKDLTVYGEKNNWYTTKVSIYNEQWALYFEHWDRCSETKKFFEKFETTVNKKNFNFIKEVYKLIKEYEKEE